MNKLAVFTTLFVLAGNLSAEEIADCPNDIIREIGELPKYPSVNTGKFVEGSIRLKAKLGPDGKLSEIEVVESSPEGYFESSAINSLKTWEFNWEGSWCIYEKVISFELEK